MTGALGRGRVGLRELRGRTFRSMRTRNFRIFFYGHMSSVTGTWMQRMGQDWLVLELTDSAVALGITLMCQFLPILVLGVPGGVIVDRFDLRRLLVATQVAQALLAVVLAVLALTGTATLGAVYVLAALLGVTSVVDNPARHTLVGNLVPREDVVNAQSLATLVNNVGRFVGPAVAGMLIAAVGVGVTFVVNAVSFVAVLVGLWLMDPSAIRNTAVATRGPGQVREGLRYVWSRPDLRMVLVLTAFVSVFGQNFRVIFPVLATRELDGDATTYGWLIAALGIGAVVGGLVGASAQAPTARRLFWVCVAFGGANAVVAGVPTLGVTLALVAVLGLLNILVNTVARSLIQLGSAAEVQGRVMAIYLTLFLGGIPVGGPLMGAVVEAWGPRNAMLVAGALVLVGCAVVWPAVRRGVETHGRAGPDPGPLQEREGKP